MVSGLGFRFRDSNYGFGVFDLEFWVLGMEFEVSHFGYVGGGFWFQMWSLGFRVSVFGVTQGLRGAKSSGRVWG